MRRLGSVSVFLTLLVALPASSQGQAGLPFGLIVSEQSRAGFSLVGAGARAAGMGGAFTAVADDATAASFNPAGLAQLLVPEVSVVMDGGRLTDDYRRFVSLDQVPTLDLSDSSLTFNRAGFNFASATLPFRLFRRRFAFQLSAQKLVDFTYSGSRDLSEVGATGTTVFNLVQSSDQTGAIRLYSGSLAVELTERMLVGVTVNRWDGRWDFSSFNSEIAAQTGAQADYFTYSQHNELKGWNADLGLLLRYPRFSVGVRYRTPFNADYRFDASLTTNITTTLQPLPATTTTLHWPGTLNLGVALKPSDRWQIALDWGRTDWSGLGFDVPSSVSSASHVNFFDLQPGSTTRADVADDLRAGTEFLFFAGSTVIPVRAGWFREPDPSRDLVTGDRIVKQGFTLGVGVKSKWLAVDASVRYGTASARVARFIEAEELASATLRATSLGELRRRELQAFLSLIIQFPAGSPPERVLQEIFVGPSKAD